MNIDEENPLDPRFTDGVDLSTIGVMDIEHQLNIVNGDSIKTGYIKVNIQIYDKY